MRKQVQDQSERILLPVADLGKADIIVGVRNPGSQSVMLAQRTATQYLTDLIPSTPS